MSSTQQLPLLTEVQFKLLIDEWTQHPITKILVEYLRVKRDELLEEAENMSRGDHDLVADCLVETVILKNLSQEIADGRFINRINPN